MLLCGVKGHPQFKGHICYDIHRRYNLEDYCYLKLWLMQRRYLSLADMSFLTNPRRPPSKYAMGRFIKRMILRNALG